MPIVVSVACNHPDNGGFEGRATAIHLPDGALELETVNIAGVNFKELCGAIRIMRRRFPVLGSQDWYGNWCWNAYTMNRRDVVRLLVYLKERKHIWQPDGGWCEFWRWWERPYADSDWEWLDAKLKEVA